MAQYDVYQNPNAAQRAVFPFLVQLQSDQLSAFSTRLIMPLQRLKLAPGALPRRLAQKIVVEEENLHLAAHLVAAIHLRALGKPVANLKADCALFVDALDAVISGV